MNVGTDNRSSSSVSSANSRSHTNDTGRTETQTPTLEREEEAERSTTIEADASAVTGADRVGAASRMDYGGMPWGEGELTATVVDASAAGATHVEFGGAAAAGSLSFDGAAALRAEGTVNYHEYGASAAAEVETQMDASANLETHLEIGDGAVVHDMEAGVAVDMEASAASRARAELTADRLELEARTRVEASVQANASLDNHLSIADGAVEVDLELEGTVKATAATGAGAHLSAGRTEDGHYSFGAGFSLEAQATAAAKVRGATAIDVGETHIVAEAGTGIKTGIGGELKAGISYDSGQLQLSGRFGAALGLGVTFQGSITIESTHIDNAVQTIGDATVATRDFVVDSAEVVSAAAAAASTATREFVSDSAEAVSNAASAAADAVGDAASAAGEAVGEFAAAGAESVKSGARAVGGWFSGAWDYVTG